MNRSRTAALSLAALLTVGGTTAVSTGLAAAQTDPSTSSTSTTVASSSTDVAVTLPGLGDIALTVDSGTGTILSLTVTPIDGVTAGDPIAVHNGVLLNFTLADGTVISRIVEVEARDGAVKVEVEPADDEATEDQEHSGPPPIAERGVSAEHRNDDNDHNNGEHRGTSTTSTTVAGAAVTSESSTTTRAPRERDDRSTTPTTRATGSQQNRSGERD